MSKTIDSCRSLVSIIIVQCTLGLLLTGCNINAEVVIDSLAASETPPTPTPPPSRLFLQQLTSHSVIVKWRGAANSACLGRPGSKMPCYKATTTDGNHKEVNVSGLQADTRYHYQIGNYHHESLSFITAPERGKLPSTSNLKIWILGDSGTASETDKFGRAKHPGDAEAVKQGFIRYQQLQGGDAPAMILLLGDNAYKEGSDNQWQRAVFDLYGSLLFQSALWPTIGNHEMGSGAIDIPGKGQYTGGGASISADPNSYFNPLEKSPARMPYLDIFSLPSKAEAGGVASGTEQYYAFDYGNLHVVSLDSQLSARDPVQRRAMRDWLITDLGSNQQDWTIVIFHHPPYTKGSHDSDTVPASRFGIDTPIVDMRREFTEVFEDYGVDLVYSGHSHSYERSYYLRGHRGDAESFNPALNAELNSSGAPASGRNEQSYRQISAGSGKDDKVVYTVAGSSGKVSKAALNHPAHAIQPADSQHRHGLAELGSVVVDVTRHHLTADFINTQGEVLDSVTISR